MLLLLAVDVKKRSLVLLSPPSSGRKGASLHFRLLSTSSAAAVPPQEKQRNNHFLRDLCFHIGMEECSKKRVVGGLGFSRRGPSVAFRDNHESRSIQYCNRLGCSTRHDSLTGNQTGNPQKFKLSRPAFLSTSSRMNVGSSSRISSTLGNDGKPQRVRQNTLAQQGRVNEASSSKKVQKEYSESNITQEMLNLDVDPPGGGIQMVSPKIKDDQSSILQEFTRDMAETSRNCQLTSSSRSHKPNGRKTESGTEGAAYSRSLVRHSVTRSVNHTTKPPRSQVTNPQKHALRNLSCTSISAVSPSGCSSSDIHQSKRTDLLRKRCMDGESSAAKGKRTIGSSSRGSLDSSRNGPSGVNLHEHSSTQAASRNRNQLTIRDRAHSVRTRRSANGDSRMRLSEQSADNTFLLPEPLMITPASQAQISLNEASTASVLRSFPTYVTPLSQNHSGRPGSSIGPSRPRPTAHSEDSDHRVPQDPWVDRDGYRRLNMEGIGEVLLALERIEQDEELTYEQLMVLQSNLFLGGLGFHDQHRAWRLDIDNMSYEELLALEEKMGTVSTALPEEELLRCLKRSIYTPISELGITCMDNDDVKCSICQEEYIVGDEVGKLHCHHRYHMTCIHQWLRQKNWCPICKSSACSS